MEKMKSRVRDGTGRLKEREAVKDTLPLNLAS